MAKNHDLDMKLAEARSKLEAQKAKTMAEKAKETTLKQEVERLLAQKPKRVRNK